MTSSPLPMPSARNASQRASVPLPTPTAYLQRQNAANSSSKRATNGPPEKAALSSTCRRAAATSSDIDWYWVLRSRNGTFMSCLLMLDFSHESGRISRYNGVGRDVLRHYTAGSHDGILSN